MELSLESFFDYLEVNI